MDAFCNAVGESEIARDDLTVVSAIRHVDRRGHGFSRRTSRITGPPRVMPHFENYRIGGSGACVGYVRLLADPRHVAAVAFLSY